MVMRLWGNEDLNLMVDILNDNEIANLKKCQGHKPLMVLSWLTKGATKDPNGLIARSIWAEVSQLVGAINGADKIASTPIPVSYHFATRCVLWVFCFSVPICIASYHHEFNNIAVSFFTSGIITFLFFLISFVSEDLEDPFSGFLSLPLDKILLTFYKDICDIAPEWRSSTAAANPLHPQQQVANAASDNAGSHTQI
jgi:predicted membrane chloride channel (bestrophin family)